MFYIKKHISKDGIADCEIIAEVNTYMDAIHYMNDLGGERLSNSKAYVGDSLYYISEDKE